MTQYHEQLGNCGCTYWEIPWKTISAWCTFPSETYHIWTKWFLPSPFFKYPRLPKQITQHLFNIPCTSISLQHCSAIHFCLESHNSAHFWQPPTFSDCKILFILEETTYKVSYLWNSSPHCLYWKIHSITCLLMTLAILQTIFWNIHQVDFTIEGKDLNLILLLHTPTQKGVSQNWCSTIASEWVDEDPLPWKSLKTYTPVP